MEMLKSSVHNATPHCILPGPTPNSFHQRTSSRFPRVHFPTTRRRIRVQASVVEWKCRLEDLESGSGSLAGRLRMGELAEDKCSYKEKFIIRCYEVGCNKTANVDTMAYLMQEVGANHAESLGFSKAGFATTNVMRSMNLIWVAVRLHLEFYKYPAWSDVVEIETWAEAEGRVGARRDWIIKDCSNGQVIGRATSKFIMMNKDTRRFQKPSDDVRNECLPFIPHETRMAFPEGDHLKRKIPKPEEPAKHSKLGIAPRRVEIDMNQHVNHAAYIGWFLESMPREIIATHELTAITMDFKRECHGDDIINSFTSPEHVGGAEAVAELGRVNGCAPADGRDRKYRSFLHFVSLSGSGLELGRSYTEWRSMSQS